MINKDTIIKLALDAHLLNYIDNETPRFYFADANAEYDDVLKFAQLLINEIKQTIEQIQDDDHDVCCINICNKILDELPENF